MAQKISISIEGKAVTMAACDSGGHLMATSWYQSGDDDPIGGQLTTLLDGRVYKVMVYEVTT